MPRGNDSSAALVDLRGEYGAASGNAEDLIKASRAALTPEARHAQNLPRDEEATADVRERWDEVEKKVGGPVLDVAVRGPFVSVVRETEGGRVYRDYLPYEDLGGKKASRHSDAAAVKESDADKAEREQVIERMQAQADAAKAAKDAEEAAEQARAKALAPKEKKSES